MSSNTYFADLHPDNLLRGLVLLSGTFLGAVGIALIFALPLHRAAASIGCCAWLVWCGWELLRIGRGYALCCRLRVSADGEVLLLDQDANWQAARLLPGSVLLRRIGWIRVETGLGQHSAELIRGSCREGVDWRRLQVIWRHIGATS
ncbi:MAG: hypothetical protein GY783_08615 [Gammaproteobacteria bacterium]|nr:hypothetical protein [Gammaproteobacteria bacterium]